MPNKILILFAHPVLERSRVNRRLLEAVADLPGVTVHDLYERYPTLNIDVEYEQALLLEHDIYVFQHPFYWYSAPAIAKTRRAKSAASRPHAKAPGAAQRREPLE